MHPYCNLDTTELIDLLWFAANTSNFSLKVTVVMSLGEYGKPTTFNKGLSNAG